MFLLRKTTIAGPGTPISVETMVEALNLILASRSAQPPLEDEAWIEHTPCSAAEFFRRHPTWSPATLVCVELRYGPDWDTSASYPVRRINWEKCGGMTVTWYRRAS